MDIAGEEENIAIEAKELMKGKDQLSSDGWRLLIDEQQMCDRWMDVIMIVVEWTSGEGICTT